MNMSISTIKLGVEMNLKKLVISKALLILSPEDSDKLNRVLEKNKYSQNKFLSILVHEELKKH